MNTLLLNVPTDVLKRVCVPGGAVIANYDQKQEVAQTIHWLLTAAPDNMTGQVLHLDGGMSNILV